MNQKGVVMPGKKQGDSRRKLLKSIAAGGGAILASKSLPESWSRPVVDAVMLPAHAQTSLTQSSGPAGDIQTGRLETDSLFANAVNSLVPAAQASIPPIGASQVCVTQTSATRGNFEAWVVYTHCGIFTVYYSANDVELSVPTTMNIEHLCNGDADAGDLLKKMGLIKDAQALADYKVTIETFTGPNGGAKGEFESSGIYGGIIPFDLASGSCQSFIPQCPEIQALCV